MNSVRDFGDTKIRIISAPQMYAKRIYDPIVNPLFLALIAIKNIENLGYLCTEIIRGERPFRKSPADF